MTRGFLKLGVPTIMENQMEKKMENEMETGIIQPLHHPRLPEHVPFDLTVAEYAQPQAAPSPEPYKLIYPT